MIGFVIGLVVGIGVTTACAALIGWAEESGE